MTPPNGDTVASTDAPTNSGPAESSEAKDTAMVDAPTESAKPPSPPAEPAAKIPEVTSEKAAESDQPSHKSVQTPAVADDTQTPVHPVKAGSPADDDQEKPDAPTPNPQSGVKAIDTKVTLSGEAQPSDLITPTTSMSQMALDASQESGVARATVDTSMTDAPSQSSAKMAREREDDEDNEPAAKRARTSGEQTAESGQPAPEPSAATDAMVVDPPTDAPASAASAPAPAPAPASESQPAPAASNDILTTNEKAHSLTDPSLNDKPITSYQSKEIRKVLGLVKKTKSGTHFRQSVELLWPGVWPQYSQTIKHPVDISLIEQNLRDGKYETMDQFKKDVVLLQANATTFNGSVHEVTNWAKSTVSQIFERLASIPFEEPVRQPKQEPKQMPTRHAEPRKPPPPKKEARPSASSPTDKGNEAQIYALLPSGIPNIRRDSTKNDSDRPKRPIHPPKNKDIGFQPKTTKNKKKPELKFCEEVLKEISGKKCWPQNQWFMEAVDPVAMNIPTYHSVVKQPMDLGTMSEKLQMGEYETAKDFKADFSLIIKNCIKFNGHEHAVSISAKELEKSFEKKWSEKASWLSKHAQPSVPPTSATSPRGGTRVDTDDEDASEAEQQDATGTEIEELERAINALTSRLKLEQSEVDKKLFSANPDQSAIEMHQGIITHLQNQMVEKRQALNKLLETKKGSQPKVSKKKASGGGAAGGTSKKTSGGAAATKKNSGGGASAKKPVKKKLNDEEKEIVSEAIARLEANALDKAIAIIKKDTGLKVSRLLANDQCWRVLLTAEGDRGR